MVEFDFKLVHRSKSVRGNADGLSRCPGGEENFPDDCPFRYDNGLINEVEHVENSSMVDMFAIDFRKCQDWSNDLIAQLQLKDEHLSVVLDLGRGGLQPPFKMIRKSKKRFDIISQLWRNYFQRFLFLSKA